ncbi:MAG: AAA family ATPase [Desulfovermiculus sp.]
MITKIKARGFKGLNFEQSLGQKNIIIGPNGSGKSARTQALILAINGYIPEVGKRNQDTFDALASDTELIVEVTIEGIKFERMFYRTKKSASQSYRVNGSKVAKDEFVSALAKVGAPKVLDLDAFLELSDSKKIDWLFRLFPPEGDVGKLEGEIERVTNKLNKTNEDQGSLKKSAQNLRKSRSELDLPNVTLAEVRQRISDTEKALKEARADLEQARIEDARAQEREAAAKQQPKQQITHGQWEQQYPGEGERGFLGPNPLLEDENRKPPFPDVPDPFPSAPLPGEDNGGPDPTESIRAIMAAMDRAGCSACAAKLVCKRELKKFKEVVPA